MALKRERPDRPRTVGHVRHDSLVRVDRRVKEILARREAALQQARRAAERLKRAATGRPEPAAPDRGRPMASSVEIHRAAHDAFNERDWERMRSLMAETIAYRREWARAAAAVSLPRVGPESAGDDGAAETRSSISGKRLLHNRDESVPGSGPCGSGILRS